MDLAVTDIALISIVDDDDTVRGATASLVRSLGFETPRIRIRLRRFCSQDRCRKRGV